MTKAIVDIETDSFDATKIHCIVASSVSGKQKVWVEKSVSSLQIGLNK